MLFLACSNYMPVPLIANRPQSLEFQMEGKDEAEIPDENENEFNNSKMNGGNPVRYAPKVYNEIVFCYESCAGIVSFKVSSDKNRPL